MRPVYFAVLLFVLSAPAMSAQESGNLLRNANFQDDWATALPQDKTLHWSYSPEYQNRRDYNPDGWLLRGSWEWLGADAPSGERRLVLRAPETEVRQRVNWVAVNDDRQLEGFPDAGGFPSLVAVRSKQALRIMRDFTLRARVKGRGVPVDAASLELALCPPGEISEADPLGTLTPSTVSASVPLPAGTFDWQWIEAKLSASAWRKSAEELAGKSSDEAMERQKTGLPLPATVSVAIRYRASAGELQVERVELEAAAPDSPNLLPNGGFEESTADGVVAGWRPPKKYDYFPPGHYYLFNTWHNEGFPNRGSVEADRLVVHRGRRSLRMPVLAGDEVAVASEPIDLHQKETRLIEVTAWVKTDRLNQLQIDAVNEKGERLDGFDFINKAPISFGTEDWRLLRQVFRPREPVERVTIMLCARGVNGYTLDGAGEQPQNNVAGTVWWDDVRLYEPESSAEELRGRGVQPPKTIDPPPVIRLVELDLGERLIGKNVLHGTLVNSGPAGTFALELDIVSPRGRKQRFRSPPQRIASAGRRNFRLPYVLAEPCPAYHEYTGTIRVVGENDNVVQSTSLSFTTWTNPLAIELGALYLRPEQKQFVRVNLGLSAAAMARVAAVRVDLLRRGTARVLETLRVPASPAAIAARREKLPAELRGDLTNLLLADVDVSRLPIERFNDPQRNWIIRATVLNQAGVSLASADSQPFCRQAHEAIQPAVDRVEVSKNLLRVNGEPWFPWGAAYGFIPVYAGPADPAPGAVRDLHNLPPWSYYDQFTRRPYNRAENDLNSLRYFPGYATETDSKIRDIVEQHWKDENLYAATWFIVPSPGVYAVEDLTRKAGGRERLEGFASFAAKAPMVVSIGPGFEEMFGTFDSASSAELAQLGQTVEELRRRTGKPIMVGHGGAWNRFEFEKVPYFDLYDPETEPLFPANLHVDLWPLVAGQDKAIWLRPQMYESIPYERWRFHTYVELMRGARGWQFAHGPGDQSTMRGLHGEIEFWKPIFDSTDPGPAVDIEPWIEHWSRRRAGKTYVIAATTHPLTLGAWRSVPGAASPAGGARVTDSVLEARPDNRLDRIVNAAQGKWIPHAIEYLPDSRVWPRGSRLAQWLRLDPESSPKGLVIMVREDGRWRDAAAWGEFEGNELRNDPVFGYWFLRHFYRNAVGFIGYDGKGLGNALSYVPERATAIGGLPPAGDWVRLEVPLAAIGAEGALVDGVGFLHEGGRVFWSRTSIVGQHGQEQVIWGDSLGPPATDLARTRIHVAGLKKGARVRVLFEDRELRAEDGFFSDDFRGQDLYQRHGGVEGYGDAPVALHLYEVP